MQPERFRDSEGCWVRRDVLITQVLIGNSTVTRDRMESIIDGLVDNGPLSTQVVGDEEYVRLSGGMAAVSHVLKNKMKHKSHKAKREIAEISL